MKTKIQVGDIMTRNLISVRPGTNLRQCAKVMNKEKTGNLIVRDGQKLIGILVEKDIIWAMMKRGAKKLDKIRAEEVATKKIMTVEPSENIDEAFQKMKKLRLKRLPVAVDGNVIGMLTWKDILKIKPSLFTELDEAISIKEQAEKFERMKGERWVKGNICEECGRFDLLYKSDNRLLCGSCRESI